MKSRNLLDAWNDNIGKKNPLQIQFGNSIASKKKKKKKQKHKESSELHTFNELT